jgi:hypothetical protein
MTATSTGLGLLRGPWDTRRLMTYFIPPVVVPALVIVMVLVFGLFRL